MGQQKFIFNDTKNVNIFSSTNDNSRESKTSPVTIKLEESDKLDTQDFCFKEDISVSKFYRDAGRFYRKIYPYREKIEKYWDAMISWLMRLP